MGMLLVAYRQMFLDGVARIWGIDPARPVPGRRLNLPDTARQAYVG